MPDYYYIPLITYPLPSPLYQVKLDILNKVADVKKTGGVYLKKPSETCVLCEFFMKEVDRYVTSNSTTVSSGPTLSISLYLSVSLSFSIYLSLSFSLPLSLSVLLYLSLSYSISLFFSFTMISS